ncbi:MAG: class I SAM-dependent methyltransferase [Beijerinckiaceae bacterium]|nr:class I SAM-dependent methyltransferase [Beijerinckiaceae bacterium]
MTSILTATKRLILDNADKMAGRRAEWREKAAFFHEEDNRYLRFVIPEGSRVLEIGCGIGDTLAALKPARGVGLDFSPGMIDEARKRHPDLEFHVGDAEDPAMIAAIEGPFDFIVVIDTVGFLDDIQGFLELLHPLCTRETRLVVGYFSHLWLPLLQLAERTGARMPAPNANVISQADLRAFAELANFDPVKSESRLLSPARLFGLGRFINRFISPLPLIRHLALRHYMVARSMVQKVVSHSVV